MFAIKLELKLNNKEKTLMAKHAGFNRFVHNYGLSIINNLDRQEYPGSCSQKIDLIKKIFTNYTKKQPENAWMNELSSKVYQHAFADLKSAFTKFFKGEAGYPKFKEKKNSQSFTVDSSNGKVVVGSNGIKVNGKLVDRNAKLIKIPTLGTFRLKEALKCHYVTQTFTISKVADKWYVSFSVDADRLTLDSSGRPLTHHQYDVCGIDLGVSAFATIALKSGDNEPVSMKIIAPSPYKKAKTKLGKKQYLNRNKCFGNRKKGIRASNNAKKFFSYQARMHDRIANKRRDFLQKTTTYISRLVYRIRLEDLNVQGMISNRKLSAAISDLGFYEFRRQMEYKQDFYGTKVEKVNRFFPSSKQCFYCKEKNDRLTLSDRIFICPHCCEGSKGMDRDLNAALNLMFAPLDQLVVKEKKKS